MSHRHICLPEQQGYYIRPLLAPGKVKRGQAVFVLEFCVCLSVKKQHNYFLGAKLVRGAYMEKERERAAIKGYADPIYPTKEATDDAFNKALVFCIDNKQRMSVLCGSHNEYSNQYLTVLMEKHSMKHTDNRVWFAQLLGMSDNISFNLSKAGYNVAKYVPYGPV